MAHKIQQMARKTFFFFLRVIFFLPFETMHKGFQFSADFWHTNQTADSSCGRWWASSGSDPHPFVFTYWTIGNGFPIRHCLLRGLLVQRERRASGLKPTLRLQPPPAGLDCSVLILQSWVVGRSTEWGKLIRECPGRHGDRCAEASICMKPRPGRNPLVIVSVITP